MTLVNRRKEKVKGMKENLGKEKKRVFLGESRGQERLERETD